MDLSHLNLRVSDPAACRSFYERHFGFRLAFEAEGGYFLRNDEGFLLALVPVEVHQPLPDGFHIGFALPGPDDVAGLHGELAGAGARLTEVEDFRPGEAYVTFRCWDPDGTEIEVFWDDARPPPALDTVERFVRPPATPERPPSTASTTTPPG